MSQSDRAIKKLATQLARLDREVKSWRGAQADYTSIEGGTMDINDSDGNLVSRVGFQEDGSGAVRFFDGPIPPVPSGVTATADGPIIQATWDGTFQDGAEATYDLAYLEVAATQVDDASNVSFATITAKEGASASVVADVTGDWVVAVRSVSQAGKKSEFATAGTVEVKITDVAGAIEAVQDSANGKNKVTYSSHAPTEDDPGIFDDTWFVGQVGRPNDVVEATNLAPNPSFEAGITQNGIRISNGGGSTSELDTEWSLAGSQSVKNTPSGSSTSAFYPWINSTSVEGELAATIDFKPGSTYTVSATLRLAGPQVAPNVDARKIIIGTIINGSASYSYALSEQAPNEAGEHRLSVTFTVPDNAMMFIRLMNGSTTTPAWWDGLTIEEGATSGEYFDGDTPSGATENESHYRWTGEPHASTSEKYLPALDIGESSNWNIIEQYRHDGNGWVKVELSHYVFSTVDLGKATVGELDGIRIMAKTISGDLFTGDAIDGKVITAPTIQSARSGRRWVGDPNGISVINEDNDVRTQLSPDGSTFKGEVEADTLVVNEGAEFKGNNTLAQGAKLTLAAGVADPTAPPVVQPFWGGLEFEEPFSDPEFTGLAFDGTSYWTISPTGQWATGGIVAQAIRINASTGAVDSFVVPTTKRDENFGVTCIGSELFWLYRRDYQAFVVVTDLNCVKLREWEYPDLGYSKTNPLVYKPGIGNDGTNIVIAQCNDAGPLNIRTFNKTTGEMISRVVDYDDLTRSDITGVYVGDADWGRKLATVAKASTSELPSFSATTGVYDGAATKFGAATPGSVGVVFHDGKFHTLDPFGVIHEYANSNTGDGDSDWWATYYWYTDVDDDDIIESTDYQSRMAPPKRFTWPRRAGLKILGQPMPDGVEALGPALAKKTTEPVRTDFSGPGWQVDSGKPSARYVTLPTNWTTYASPSATNTFPEAESSVLESASGTFRVRGDGSGHWGPLTMGRNGIMSGLIVSGEQVLTPEANAVSSVEVTFPPGRFTTTPRVALTQYTTQPQNYSAGAWPVSQDSFVLNIFSTTNAARRVTWFAMDGGS